VVVVGVDVTDISIVEPFVVSSAVGEGLNGVSSEGLVAMLGGSDGPGATLGATVGNAGLVSFPHLKTGTFSKVPSRDLLLYDNLQGVVLFPGTI